MEISLWRRPLLAARRRFITTAAKADVYIQMKREKRKMKKVNVRCLFVMVTSIVIFLFSFLIFLFSFVKKTPR
jgi:hypothetical protein